MEATLRHELSEVADLRASSPGGVYSSVFVCACVLMHSMLSAPLLVQGTLP